MSFIKNHYPEIVQHLCCDDKQTETLSQSEKIALIEEHFAEILKILGLDLTDDSLHRTPHRVAKMFVLELFSGLDEENFPKITTQLNKFNYTGMLLESKISVKSMCEHHFVPILGYCHIAYLPKAKLIGLSKLNRITEYFSRRPQVQERLTKQILECLVEVLETDDVAVVVDAVHMCVRLRGIQDTGSLTRTFELSGKFHDSPHRQDFFSAIPQLQDLKL